jgi:hypothetical protein
VESSLEDLANELHARLLRLARRVDAFERRAMRADASEQSRSQYAAVRMSLGIMRKSLRQAIELGEDWVGGALLRAFEEG